MYRLLLVSLVALAAFAQTLQAQIQVGLQIKHRLYVAYEPIMATVTVRNLSGRDLPLADEGARQWFGFQVLNADDQPIPPLDAAYKLSPLIIPAGQTVRRTINLNALYPVHDYGLYRVRATIYFSPLKKYFQSPPENVEVSEGKVIWQQVAGVPDGMKGSGSNRKISALTFRQAESNYLYVRVEDSNTGVVYCTYRLGRLLAGIDPQIQLDVTNNLHVLQVFGPKAYLYSRIGINGEWLGQNIYLSVNRRPSLQRDRVGEISVVGGQLQETQTAQNSAKGADGGEASGIHVPPGVPKLSDRPAGLPKD